MKAPAFQYCRPESLAQALELVERFGDDARVLAGGQSLLPSLALRLSAPVVLIDVGRLPELRGIEETVQGIRIGAMARHQEVERSALVGSGAPLLAAAMPWVAHPPIRARGTYGGSVALADPAAEAPAATLAHSATLLARSTRGERRIAADDFFLGLYQTALEPGEILVGAEFEKPRAGERFVFRELARRCGDFATVGVALRASTEGRRVRDARVVLFGVSDRPVTAPSVATVLVGSTLDSAAVAAAVDSVASDVEPFADLHHDEATKLHLMRVLLRRTLVELEKGMAHA